MIKIMKSYKNQLAQESLENFAKSKMIPKIIIQLKRLKRNRTNHVKFRKLKLTKCLVFYNKKEKNKMI